MDAIVKVPVLTEKTVAFLSPVQADAYGEIVKACEALKVDALCEPEHFLEQTVGIYPWFLESGHA